VLDSFHSLARQIPSNSIRSIPKDKIFTVQLADAPAIQLHVLQWSRHLRNMPGQAELPVTEFMLAVATTGYDGVLSLEIFNGRFRGAAPNMIARDGQRSLLALMDAVALRANHPVFGTGHALSSRRERHRVRGIRNQQSRRTAACEGSGMHGVSAAWSPQGKVCDRVRSR
jgi:4-hydroxyphenylpyruvate dioxygenase